MLLLHVLNALCDRVLLIGCGKERDLDDRRFRQIMAKAVTTLHHTGATEAVCYLTDLNVKGRENDWQIRQAVEAAEEALYQFNEFKSKKEPPRRTLRRLILAVPNRRELPAGEQAVRAG